MSRRWLVQSLTAHLVATGFALQAPVALAQCQDATFLQTVRASDPAQDAFFGASVAVDGTTIAIGAPFSSSASNAAGIGAVYVWTRPGDFVAQQQKVMASDGTLRNLFGSSVALLGNTLLVGAPGDNGGRGAAYVFTRSGTTWTQIAKLVASDAAAGDRFGSSVSLTSVSQRTVAVIGAPNDDNFGPEGATGGVDAGAAYVFTRNTVVIGAQWAEVEKLMASDGSAGDQLGWSLSLRGGTTVIGAHRDATAAGSAAGSAYVFVGNITASTWTQQARLVPDNGDQDDIFGLGISYESNTALIGAPGQEGGFGGFYVFTRDGSVWTQAQYIPGTPSPSLADFFGGSLALNGDFAAVGSLSDSLVRPSVKLFRRVNGVWTPFQEFVPNGSSDGFGAPVAFQGNTLAIAAPFSSGLQSRAGIVWAYDFVSGPATQISLQPSDVSVCPGEAASFDVQAEGTQLTYRWQYLTAPDTFVELVDGESALGTVSGAATPNLTFTSDQSRVVRCRLTGACSVVNTDAVVLTVRAADDPVCSGAPVCPACAADYDQDGGVTGGDIAAFFIDFEFGAACADVDLDGGITGADIGAFFVLFEAGGC